MSLGREDEGHWNDDGGVRELRWFRSSLFIYCNFLHFWKKNNKHQTGLRGAVCGGLLAATPGLSELLVTGTTKKVESKSSMNSKNVDEATTASSNERRINYHLRGISCCSRQSLTHLPCSFSFRRIHKSFSGEVSWISVDYSAISTTPLICWIIGNAITIWYETAEAAAAAIIMRSQLITTAPH